MMHERPFGLLSWLIDFRRRTGTNETATAAITATYR